jgi:uncharacterized membrane protein
VKARHIWLILFGGYGIAMQFAKALGMVKSYSVTVVIFLFIAWAIVALIALVDLFDWAASRRRAELTERIMRRAAEK